MENLKNKNIRFVLIIALETVIYFGLIVNVCEAGDCLNVKGFLFPGLTVFALVFLTFMDSITQKVNDVWRARFGEIPFAILPGLVLGCVMALLYFQNIFPVLVKSYFAYSDLVFFLLITHFLFSPGMAYLRMAIEKRRILSLFSLFGVAALSLLLIFGSDTIITNLPNSLLMWQVLASFFVLFVVCLFKNLYHQKKSFDWTVFFLLWGIAAISWVSVDLGNTYYYPLPIQENGLRSLASDARSYDWAANLMLMGFGREVNFGSRPIFITLLTVLKFFVGFDTPKLIFYQTILLSSIPALIYLIGKELGKRELGKLTAVLYIFRERNEILNPWGTITVQNIMTEPWMILGVLLVTLFSLRWIIRKENNPKLALVIGGLVGLFSLIRPNILFLFPIPFLFTFQLVAKDKRKFVSNILLAVLSLILVVTPVMVRNMVHGYGASTFSGKLNLILKRSGIIFNSIENSIAEEEKVETNGGKSAKKNQKGEKPQKASVPEIALDKLILSVSILPQDMIPTDISSTQEGESWKISLAFMLNLLLLGLGVYSLWRSHQWVGLVPLAVYLFYFSTILIGLSPGNRHFIPIEWIVFFLYSSGLLYTFKLIFKQIELFSPDVKHEIVKQTEYRSDWQVFGLLAIFLLIGCSPILLEFSNQPKPYLSVATEEIRFPAPVQTALEFGGVSSLELEAALKTNPSLRIYQGKSFYHEYLYGVVFFKYPDESFFHVDFSMKTEDGVKKFVVPLSSSPDPIPNGSEILVIGCDDQKSNLVAGWGYVVLDDSPELILRNPKSDLECPLPRVSCKEKLVEKCKNIPWIQE